MKRVKLIVAYDGTGYCGWQVQPNEITVEGVLSIKCKTTRRYHYSGFQRSAIRLPSKVSGYKKDI